ncbi:hypothetical protein SAMN02927921_01921 [Sinomicrobium oceani]|uniref:Copper-binding protein MbnP-like domain-containing protein n=1 Tax=Sinomicrobium oceani TaxID=1150368 RepID=A0A1K1PPI2_9FLAO|nr:MbnP family protein [Sinomicrobium oceani]SFW49618.1 hypothetical protein SAMN02927921_01921 [Sinomicrobium oceani]
MKNYKLALIYVLTVLTLAACNSDDDHTITGEELTATLPGTLNLTLDAVVGQEDFELHTTYDIEGQQLNFNQFRYWISHVILTDTDGEEFSIEDSYYLMEETEAISIQDGAYEYPANKRETITLTGIPAGSYTSIKFAVGIDPAYNDNLSLQAGELSQLNGMTNISWMWHTSYIFASLKGTDTGNDTQLQLETGLNSSYRTVVLTLDKDLEIGGDTDRNLTITTDIAGILNGIKVTETPVIGASTPEAMTTMADNFESNTFTVVPADEE